MPAAASLGNFVVYSAWKETRALKTHAAVTDANTPHDLYGDDYEITVIWVKSHIRAGFESKLNAHKATQQVGAHFHSHCRAQTDLACIQFRQHHHIAVFGVNLLLQTAPESILRLLNRRRQR